MKTPPTGIRRTTPAAGEPTIITQFIRWSHRDYVEKFGNRYGSSIHYFNLISPELIKRSGSLEQLKALDQQVKALIREFITLRLGRHSDYVLGILFPLIRKTDTLADLKAWDSEAKKLVAEYKMKGIPLCWSYVICILPELIKRSNTVEEIKAWGTAANKVVASLTEDKEHNIRQVIPEMIKSATDPSELEAWADLFAG